MPVGSIAAGGFFVPRGYASEFLYLCEVVFDQVSPFVGIFIVVSLIFSVRFGRDNRCGSTVIELVQ